MSSKPFPDVLVLVPGIMGSVLSRGRHDVWGLSFSALGNLIGSLGTSVHDLELPGDDPAVDDIDGVTATRLIDDVVIVPRLWRVDGYTHIRQTLMHHLNLRLGENYFEFPYDWRRDNRAAARQLCARAKPWLDAWRVGSGNPAAKLVFVVHSMGGLVCRYFLEKHEGWRDTRALVTIGTPHRGSLNALDFLANGYLIKKWGVRLANLSTLLRSFTSVYQLLPIYPCIDDGSGTMRRVTECERLPKTVDLQRAKQADAFYREIEAAVADHRKNDEYTRQRYEVTGVVGTFQPTLLSARLSGDSLEMLREHPEHAKEFTGDGTVPMVSAVPLEFDSLKNEPGWNALLATERHGSLQNGDAVIANALNALGGFAMKLGAIRGARGLSLDIGDLFATSEPVSLSVASSEELRRLAVDVVDARTGVGMKRLEVNARTARTYTIDIGRLPEGTYRVTVARAEGASPDSVTDLILVLGAI
jgi:pimeloyl-ACP methyl ester carboxylesterase